MAQKGHSRFVSRLIHEVNQLSTKGGIQKLRRSGGRRGYAANDTFTGGLNGATSHRCRTHGGEGGMKEKERVSALSRTGRAGVKTVVDGLEGEAEGSRIIKTVRLGHAAIHKQTKSLHTITSKTKSDEGVVTRVGSETWLIDEAEWRRSTWVGGA